MKPTPDKETLRKWSQDPANWKFGIFYYNKVDKRILPPKRNKWLGWTINFASPVSVFVLIIVIVTCVWLGINKGHSGH
jgi:uncharacterized membrane protein